MLLCILALSEVLSWKIRLFYYKTENLDESFMYNGTFIPPKAGPEEVSLYLVFAVTTSIWNIGKRFVTNHFMSLITFMKT